MPGLSVGDCAAWAPRSKAIARPRANVSAYLPRDHLLLALQREVPGQVVRTDRAALSRRPGLLTCIIETAARLQRMSGSGRLDASRRYIRKWTCGVVAYSSMLPASIDFRAAGVMTPNDPRSILV
jgi:hypothetical protein